MSVNLQNSDDRKKYLSEKLDDLMDGINDSYGTVLMDELISRMERTVSDFNEEVTVLMEQLKLNSERRDELMEKIKSGAAEEAAESEVVADSGEREMSEWEKRLEQMDK